MKKLSLCIAASLLLLAAIQAAAAPPRYAGGYRGGGYHGHPVAHHQGWRGAYWGPRVGVYVGPGLGYRGPWAYGWGPGFGFPYPYAYPYAAGYPVASVPLVIDATPVTQTYVQQQPVAEAAIQPAAPVTNFWFYCTQPAGYFPYVQSCTQPWITVSPPNPANSQ